MVSCRPWSSLTLVPCYVALSPPWPSAPPLGTATWNSGWLPSPYTMSITHGFGGVEPPDPTSLSSLQQSLGSNTPHPQHTHTHPQHTHIYPQHTHTHTHIHTHTLPSDEQNSIATDSEDSISHGSASLCWAPAEPFSPLFSVQTMPRAQRKGLLLIPFQTAKSPYQTPKRFSLQVWGRALKYRFIPLGQSAVLRKVTPLPLPPSSRTQKQKAHPSQSTGLKVAGKKKKSLSPSLSLPAACHFLKHEGCINYYLEKFVSKGSWSQKHNI